MVHRWTAEQRKFVKDNLTGMKQKDTLVMFNEHFGTEIKINQLRAFVKNNGFTSGLNTRFKKGQVPVNKGTQGLYNVGGNSTSFKPGERAINYKPVGYERIDRDGYVLVKVQDDGPWHKRWRHKHKVMWEKECGPIPPGHVLLFADQNKQNLALDNLILITRKQLVTLNKKDLLANNADLTRTGIIVADIYQRISDRKKIGHSAK
ncbi:HNH endonuclease signature motif containing protein [Sporosarcina sp. FSL K6-5500]|uniref:HNH endonuclease signature motif containing protein n=1 Tax=Sporosarcina sp. FSL K6-5500 TaxID=2921558 RepID=UPI0030F6F5BD